MENIKIKLHNDGKGKHQSFEAYLSDINEHIGGYGATQKEALVAMMSNLEIYIEKLQAIETVFTGGEYMIEEVDCVGDVIGNIPVVSVVPRIEIGNSVVVIGNSNFESGSKPHTLKLGSVCVVKFMTDKTCVVLKGNVPHLVQIKDLKYLVQSKDLRLFEDTE